MENSPIKAIKTEEQYKIILQQIKGLWNCAENSPEADLLEVLSILADDYESKHYPIDLPDPIEAIKYKMEENDLTANDLVPYFGSRSKVSEVLNRKRPLTFTMAKKLFKGLNIPAETLLSF
ncbi:MAG: transcriptional regulator, family [Mucilaginibacter sp.]|jgi:HTH-type transcriptional regulator/antitoxin HigA|nr:transcriptional regulator, family [Mucilaginibacter sp.]